MFRLVLFRQILGHVFLFESNNKKEEINSKYKSKTVVGEQRREE